MGRLVFVEGSEIASAFRAGDLTSDDILLTDHVPAEIPRVAGIIALNPSTLNSHVAILAKNFGVPLYFEGNEATREARCCSDETRRGPVFLVSGECLTLH